MKKHLFLLFFIFTSALMFSQATGSVGIGTTNPDSSAALDISGIDPTNTIRGFLAPRMTLAQKIAIASPATGLLIYQTDDSIGFWYFDGTLVLLVLSGHRQKQKVALNEWRRGECGAQKIQL